MWTFREKSYWKGINTEKKVTPKIRNLFNNKKHFKLKKKNV